MSCLAVIVGAAAAYAAIAFRMIADVVATLLYGVSETDLHLVTESVPLWLVVAGPAAGGLVIGLLCTYVLPGPVPQGVAEVIEANALRNGRMNLKAGISAALVSAGSIGVGASVGREGPIVHLGATLAAFVSKHCHLGPSLGRTLLGCGVSAAIAAAFNAPIAGVFFALEVVIGHYGLGAFSPVVIASVIGTIVTRVHIGDAPAFQLPPQYVSSFFELPAFLLLGIGAGLLAILLIKSIGWVQDAHKRLNVPTWLQPAIGGLLVGLIAVYCPEILGVGYFITDAALNGSLTFDLLLLYAVAKAVATALSLGSRFGGGIISSSLAIGALFGGAFGMIATSLFPELGSATQVYAVIGMGAVAAAAIGAPISTVIMIFELTGDYGVTFALMAAVGLSAVTARQFFGPSFFGWQLARRGVEIEGNRETSLLRSKQVADVMRPNHIQVQPEATIDELKRQFRRSHAPIFVVDDENRLTGSVSFEDLADCVFDGESKTAQDLSRKTQTVLTPNDDLATAISRCLSRHEEHIPVVRSRESMEIIGEVRHGDLVQAYNRALLEARAAEQGRS